MRIMNFSSSIFFYILTLLIMCCSPAISYSQDYCECHMPPLDQSKAAMHAAFSFKKAVSRRAITAERQKNGAPDRSYSESRPYEHLRPAAGDHRTIAILVDFDDRPYYNLDSKCRTTEYYNNLIFDMKYKSLNRYYNEVSSGIINFSGIIARSAPGESAASYWHRSKKNYREWGRDLDAFENIDSANISELAYEAIESASTYIDFSIYDSDKDGIISPHELHIVILHSGSGQEKTGASDDIWSHRYSLETPFKANGVIIENYILLAHDSPLGVLCHEMGHDLGLFDIYDTHNGKSVLGSWSLMDRGAWNATLPLEPGSTPSFPSAYERIALGWIKPTIISSFRDELYLKCASSTQNTQKLNGFPVAEAVKFEVASSNGKQYLLLENRYKSINSFDECIPPLLKRENGVIAYLVNENMPDKTPYQFANDERNTNYRIRIAEPIDGSIEYAFYGTEFSKFSSELQNFQNNVPNAFRANMPEKNGEFYKVIFNMPIPELAFYEVRFSEKKFNIKAAVKNFNKDFTSLSVAIFVKPKSSNSKYYSETPLVENVMVSSENFSAVIDANNLNLTDSDSYYAKFNLTDGAYTQNKTYGPFPIDGAGTRFLKAYPAAINKGEITLNVYLSDAAIKNPQDSEEVFFSYRSSGGYKIEKQAIDYTSGESIRPYRSYKFIVDDEVDSNVLITVKPAMHKLEILTAEVALLRSEPVISHGVYASSILKDIITFICESDRRLFQAQLDIYEPGRATTSVALYKRSEGASNVYYYNHKASAPADYSKIEYSLNCIDYAGNKKRIVSEGETGIYSFSMTPSCHNFAIAGGSIEIEVLRSPGNYNQATAYLRSYEDEKKIKISLLPSDMPLSENETLIRVTPKLKSGRSELLNSAGIPETRQNDGSYILKAMGEYSLANASKDISAGLASIPFAPVPNPASRYVRFIGPLTGTAIQAKLSIYDSNATKIEDIEDYRGLAVDISNYACGVYFYLIKGERAGVSFEARGKFSVLR